MKDINNAKSKEIAAQKAKEFATLRNEALNKKGKAIPVQKNLNTDQLAVGDHVIIGESENEGEIIEIRGKNAVVAVRGLRTTIALKKLQKIAIVKTKNKNDKRRVVYQEVEKTFDIRGLMQEEARPIIEQYFDQALYNNVESIKIIHGKGSGALRKQLQQLIKEYKGSISTWKYEEEKQGGNGATIISFK